MADPARLREEIGRLGIRGGGVLMVHASLGGTGLAPGAVRDVLLDALGPGGTLVVPAFTPENSDTSPAYHRRTEGMSEREKAEFRASMPPFEPDTSPCPTMGALAECVRTTPGAVRSLHPQTSFAGLGPRAAELLADHDPYCHLGERSPLASLYAADAQILLLRVGFEVCTAFHLAEYRMPGPPPIRTYRCVVKATGNWIEYEDLDLHDGDFGEIGARLPRDLVTEGEVAGKAAVLLGMRDAVDTACELMSGYRGEMA
ncbi:AAC(3) family N-acetyltransferase [Streptomyces ipomoeae]|uniref:Aminoglycoside 3-N-acetyltransferase n=1 Tax=Streptomyces ipomoeae 91-03 TaxID=698759 RepID=L1L3X5_9ACTN|nr:AAC(3) family N-acetyltransferase [Streptomyces ipomoeae]EKX67405.1 aminoglycoside 3-N-acetyltransferase [Streptomyces ipomoeae 91-03]MDX2700231.1 AAC(3) family N-acetyltransferase [Streptomyces ipomoeae]MDX2846288.1 AAC(3) family N-acetyltransferase [Streptomyces ipomoeae]TQE31465.1 AAC(3) family N-acetyltransferase [Streptomyces ipomoeae]